MVSEAEKNRMTELVGILNNAAKHYYAEDEEIMTNFEYDRLYDELAELERKTGITLNNSPTIRVGYESVEELPKERHEKPMLSLDKTKSREELRDWLQGKEALLSWKLDGLTVVLTYEGGRMVKAVTRGNGEIGEVITANAKTFENIPRSIPFRGKLILRGEAVIRYSDFNKINEKLEEEAAEEGSLQDVRYKNPRNLCSGSVRQLDSSVTARRHVQMFPFALVSAVEEDGTPVDFGNSRKAQFDFLTAQGFEVVEHYLVTPETILGRIAWFEEKIQHYDIPSDGLVLLLEDIAYGDSLGRTAKFPRNAIAFKWADDTQETILREVEWSASRTGLINPVAVFDPVELEGTTVRRASVHNVSIVRSLQLGIGDHLMIYKANMIIPQVAENLTKSGTLPIPETCPVCGGRTEIRRDNDAESLFCVNPECPAKKIKAFTLFVSRNAMNIDGLSEMTLEKFIAKGFIREFADIYHLPEHEEEIVGMDGFGRKSYDNLTAAVDRSRDTTARRVLTALGIPGIGSAGARLLCGHFHNDLARITAASEEELSAIDGIGPVLAANFVRYFADPVRRKSYEDLLAELRVESRDATVDSLAAAAGGSTGSGEQEGAGGQGNGIPAENTSQGGAVSGSASGAAGAGSAASGIAGKTFVITGSVKHFANRDEVKELIESLGGKVSGSVSKKTDYLINNDVNSTSGKNKKAKELGIPILSEEDFMAMCKVRR